MLTVILRWCENNAFRSFLLFSLIVVSVAFGSVCYQKTDRFISYIESNSHTENNGATITVFQKIFSDPGILSNFAVAAFTGLLSFIAVVQLWVVHRSNQTAAISANAALESASLAQRTLIANQRAWLKITKVRPVGDFNITEDSAGLMLQVCFENIGNSIANNVGSQTWLLAEPASWNRETSMAEVHRRKCIEHKRLLGNETLYPGEASPTHPEWNGGVGCVIDPKELAAAAISRDFSDRRTVSFFVGGIVTYNFPTDTEIHQTTFCNSLDFERGRIPVDIGPISSRSIELGGRFNLGAQPPRFID